VHGGVLNFVQRQHAA